MADAGSKITGRIHPTTLGTSAIDDIKTRTGPRTPSRSAAASTSERIQASAGAPSRRSADAWPQLHASRSANNKTPIAHAGSAQASIKAYQEVQVEGPAGEATNESTATAPTAGAATT